VSLGSLEILLIILEDIEKNREALSKGEEVIFEFIKKMQDLGFIVIGKGAFHDSIELLRKIATKLSLKAMYLYARRGEE